MKIGIVGAGFVGGAIKNAYDTYNVPVIVRDPFKGFDASWKSIRDCHGVFVCVPSPSKENGEADTSYLEDVLENLKGMKGVIISKVTAPPSVYAKLQTKYPNLVHAPEFLVAASAKQDYINGTFSLLGGCEKYTILAEELIRLGQKNLNFIVKHCTIAEAALAKYTINSFLALKVSFMNQLFDLSEQLEVDYNVLRDLIACDSRIGNSHLNVPGPDGYRGFGGACFPKDVKAIVAEAKKVNTTLNILEVAIQYNNDLKNSLT